MWEYWFLSFSLWLSEKCKGKRTLNDAIHTLSFTYHVWTLLLLSFSLSVLLKVSYCNCAVLFNLVIVQFLGCLCWQEKFTLSLLLCYLELTWGRNGVKCISDIILPLCMWKGVETWCQGCFRFKNTIVQLRKANDCLWCSWYWWQSRLVHNSSQIVAFVGCCVHCCN